MRRPSFYSPSLPPPSSLPPFSLSLLPSLLLLPFLPLSLPSSLPLPSSPSPSSSFPLPFSHLGEAFHIWNSKGQTSPTNRVPKSRELSTRSKLALPNESDKVQITVEGADHPYEKIRIQNTDRQERRQGPVETGCKVQFTVRTRAADDLCTK